MVSNFIIVNYFPVYQDFNSLDKIGTGLIFRLFNDNKLLWDQKTSNDPLRCPYIVVCTQYPFMA